MRGMRHIPVDRDAGLDSYRQALAVLKAGEVVGVFPEATISRSFTLKDMKSGATRMAAAVGVLVIPMALWGSQRLWTNGRPRHLARRGTPVSIAIGEPLPADIKSDSAMAESRRRMSELLDGVQRAYPDQPAGPKDRWWLPAHLGGTAPTPRGGKGARLVRPGLIPGRVAVRSGRRGRVDLGRTLGEPDRLPVQLGRDAEAVA